MAKKCKCPPPGAPDWMMTYGDMMTLLMCFFVLIVSFSEIKKEDKFSAVIEEIKKALGVKGGGGTMPTEDDPALSLLKLLDEPRVRWEKVKGTSSAEDPGQEGRHAQVTRIREGELYALTGGRIAFEPGSAELTASARHQLDTLIPQLRGLRTMIELRGHADRAEMDLTGQGRAFPDLWSLSHARARTVMGYLTAGKGEGGSLDANRFRLVANADREPVAQRVYDASQRAPNRRVEVLISDDLREQFTRPEQSADE